MASSKNTKRNLDAAADPSKMSNLERLILVQAVYEFGNNAWPEVSKLLSAHPMLAHSKQRFTCFELSQIDLAVCCHNQRL